MKKYNRAERSENLTVVFTDIAGFTETTARQSRDANALMLKRHDKLLIPIAEQFGGRRVKSIGDALLLVFRSSTDALLCCMAMQDALFDHNRKYANEPAIHIRTAVNVGEVRVVSGDIFGEAVNIAARLEGITPRDAIYLTKAVHMTMNRAEVPVEEVGMQRFKGIEEEIQVYQVPRFISTKLVVDAPLTDDERINQSREGFVYPYGGVHLMKFQVHRQHEPGSRRFSWWLLLAAVAGLLLAFVAAVVMWPDAGSSVPPQASPIMVAPTPSPLPPPGALRGRIGPRLGSGGLPLPAAIARFKIENLMADIWPWLLDQRWYIAPTRLMNTALPLGKPQPDPEAGALPLPWNELPGPEQVLFASLRDSWDTLEPSYQHHLVTTATLWRDASQMQRQAVLAERIHWQQAGGVDRNIAARRLDYLRGLEADKRWQIINRNKLALPLGGAAAGGSSGVEVRQPIPPNIRDRPAGTNINTPPGRGPGLEQRPPFGGANRQTGNQRPPQSPTWPRLPPRNVGGHPPFRPPWGTDGDPSRSRTPPPR